MNWKIVYYNEKVQSILNAWPVGLRAYIKKSEKTPRKELEIARKRQKEVKRENTSRND